MRQVKPREIIIDKIILNYYHKRMDINKKHKFSSKKIKAHLDKSNCVNKIYNYKIVTSTNDVAKDIFKNGFKNNFLVIASKQTAGRGRGEKSFYSPLSGLYLTLCIPNISVGSLETLTCAAAVSASLAIEEKCAISPAIKWVNDLYLDGKKISGILCENVFSEKNGNSAVLIGIGINLSDTSSFPEDIRNTAGYISLKTSVEELIGEIVNNLFIYANLPADKIISEYKKRSLMIGKEISYIKDGKEMQATVTDIDNLGRLTVINSLGKTETLSSGEIKITSFNKAN